MRKRLVLLGLSLAILAVLWHQVDWRSLLGVCRRLDPLWFALALAMFVPQTLLTGARWAWIVRGWQPLGTGAATAMVLASNALNVILPSKMGDVAKGAFLRPDLPGGDPATGIALGLFEKGLDTAALGVLMLASCVLAPPDEPVGLFLAGASAAGVLVFLSLLARPVAAGIARRAEGAGPGLAGKAWRAVGAAGSVLLRLRERPGRLAGILSSAVLLWALHLLQFSFVHRAAGGQATEALLWSRIPMAIFVGLLPFTFAGVGTRDAAMVYFLGGPAGKGVALALGVFATVRYLVVALAGVPFLGRLRRARA